ncbi:glycoside hydrolase family 2 protein [Pseudochryseolinea flava]|uniref:Beta-galactosidase n=1 Tax=Pseudochryseolinea flava TaxID=2059302 RepID=A0A364Y400_9BACT|nr:sugar-binding domain-containing protein [Pseudochryseolinea flava]RAW01652.1 beta-galactosidase [Pseudochryseolinea flava]
MIKYLIAGCICLGAVGNQLHGQSASWKIAEGKITTPWADEVNANNPLPEYPRPQMVRENWVNLNGLWDYAIIPKAASVKNYDGKILVPFAVESALSGVSKTVGKDSKLWYKRTITLPSGFKGKSVLLHFGAVDWECEVFVNGQKIGTHAGGYDPFSFDATAALKKSGAQEIVVSVWDPSDNGPQPRGKQIEKPHGIWYTPVSGIWQTVWMEAVPKTYVQSTKQISNLDESSLNVSSVVQNAQAGDVLRVSVWEGAQKVAEGEGAFDNVTVKVPNAKHWSPQNPFLYDLKIAVVRKGKVVDEVKSYFGMRKISVGVDAQGIQRMLLNNEFLFQYGPLDQGWWPDGLYTPPTEKALLFDIEKTKAMGFNMIRKHVKVEPARWYYHCDRLGILVWQDMPSGDIGNRWENRPGVYGLATDKDRSPESESIFKKEWKAIMDATMNYPSVVVWVPFNEAWGQFKTEEIVQWTMKYDPSRLVNAASGGNFTDAGHILDLHNYPEPAMPAPTLFGAKQILVLGEFGGLGLPLDGHTWQTKNNWGYQSFTSKEELFKKYESFMGMMEPLIKKGLSAAVYTQTTDVEVETNGLMTYDRKVVKFPEDKLKQLHEKFYNASLVKLKK